MAKQTATRPATKTRREDYPMILRACHIAEIMGVSRPTAYAYMKQTDFPMARLPGSIKCVGREAFFSWFDQRTGTA